MAKEKKQMMDLFNVLGVSFLVAAIINSQPYLYALAKLDWIEKSFLTCGLCLGFWAGLILAIYGNTNLFATAGCVSILAELTDRILRTWRI